ncbi:MAG: glycosyltransferase family 2 protein [Methanobacteriaceae archaeon]|nr:glycosyltransferase family 2 protein [Methanobacteriaceae archaeon]
MLKEDTEGVYLVIPAYNEERNIAYLLDEIAKKGYHIVLVNDGSSDKTFDIAMEIKDKYPDLITVISHVINRGVGAATKTGMDVAYNHGAKYIVTFDGDGQHAIEDIPKVCKPLKEGVADAVTGARPLKDMPLTKTFANRIMNFLTLFFYNANVMDSQTGLRAITAESSQKINILSRGYGISSEFIKEIKNNNLRYQEVIIKTIYTEETQHKGTNFWVGLKLLIKFTLDFFNI